MGVGRADFNQSAYAQTVFDYVRNNIATEFRFGLGKGARGALIDQSGTPFDQAELMVKLLRMGGVTAGYEVGTATFSAQQFGQWTGLVNSVNQATQTVVVNPTIAGQFLADGGIPATIALNNDGSLASVTMGHIVVTATIGGATNLYDPSFKRFTLKSGIDIAAAAGCETQAAATCGATIKNDLLAKTTQTSIQGNTVFIGANSASIAGDLNGYAKNIEGVIRSSLPTAQLDDIVGGAEIDTTFAPTGSGSIPYFSQPVAQVNGPSVLSYTWSGEIPDAFRTTFSVAFSTFASPSLYADELSGRTIQELTCPSNSSLACLVVDNITIPMSTQPTSTANGQLEIPYLLTIAHPYAGNGFANESVSLNTQFSSVGTQLTYIILQLGQATYSTQKYYADLESALNLGLNVDLSVNTRLLNSNSMLTMASNWLVQQYQAEKLVSGVTNSLITNHHRIGIVTNNKALVGTSPQQSVNFSFDTVTSVESGKGIASARAAAFQADAAMSAMLEGSILQQANDTPAPLSGLSELVLLSNNGWGLMNVPSSKMGPLTNAGSGFFGSCNAKSPAACNLNPVPGYQTYASAPYNVNFIIPVEEAAATYPANVTFIGAPQLGYSTDGTTLSYLMNLIVKGGTEPMVSDPAAGALQAAKEADYAVNKKKYLSVDAASAQLRLEPTPDLVAGVGDFPYSLPFQRTYEASSAFEPVTQTILNLTSVLPGPYSNADADSAAKLGGNWANNYQISARLANNGLKAMGQDSGLDAAATIAGVYSLQDALSAASANSSEYYLTGMFIAYWLSQQFINNTVDIHRGAETETFELMPSGVFNPPPGRPDRLIQNGARAGPYQTQGGIGFPQSYYDYLPVTFSLTYGDGSTLKFDAETGSFSMPNYPWQPVFKATDWTFPSGIVVKFNYTLGTLIATGTNNSNPVNSTYVLTSVKNSLGRALYFGIYPDITYNYSSLFGWRIVSVTDESQTHHVYFALNNCASTPSGDGNASPKVNWTWQTAAFNCGQFQVTAPDNTSTTTYDYVPAADSPDLSAIVERPNYLLRRWYTPGAAYSLSNMPTPFETIAYDQMGRVMSVTDALGRTGQTFASALFPSEWWKKTDQIDPISFGSKTPNVTTSWFDQFGDLLMQRDPLGRVTSYAYDGLRRRTRVTQPMGDYVTYDAYDVRSNLLQSTRHPITGSAYQAITIKSSYGEGSGVWICKYPASCNKPFSSIDGLGNVKINNVPVDPLPHTTYYSWDNDTGLLKEVKRPADNNNLNPVVDLYYSTFSNTVDKVTYSFQMLTSKVEAIDAVRSITTNYSYDSGNKFTLSSSTVDSTGLALRTCYKFDTYGNLQSISDPRAVTCP